MRFTKKILAVAALAGVSAALLTGCGASAAVGKWEVKEVSVGGQTYKEGDDINGIPAEGIIQIELKNGGKCNLSALGQSADIGKWSEDGNKITISDDKEDTDDEMEFEIDGDEMKLTKSPTDEFSEGLVLKKVDSFTEVDLSVLGGGSEE